MFGSEIFNHRYDKRVDKLTQEEGSTAYTHTCLINESSAALINFPSLRSLALGQLVGLSTDAWKGACVTADSDSDSDDKRVKPWPVCARKESEKISGAHVPRISGLSNKFEYIYFLCSYISWPRFWHLQWLLLLWLRLWYGLHISISYPARSHACRPRP